MYYIRAVMHLCLYEQEWCGRTYLFFSESLYYLLNPNKHVFVFNSKNIK